MSRSFPISLPAAALVFAFGASTALLGAAVADSAASLAAPAATPHSSVRDGAWRSRRGTGPRRARRSGVQQSTNRDLHPDDEEPTS